MLFTLDEYIKCINDWIPTSFRTNFCKAVFCPNQKVISTPIFPTLIYVLVIERHFLDYIELKKQCKAFNPVLPLTTQVIVAKSLHLCLHPLQIWRFCSLTSAVIVRIRWGEIRELLLLSHSLSSHICNYSKSRLVPGLLQMISKQLLKSKCLVKYLSWP